MQRKLPIYMRGLSDDVPPATHRLKTSFQAQNWSKLILEYKIYSFSWILDQYWKRQYTQTELSNKYLQDLTYDVTP